MRRAALDAKHARLVALTSNEADAARLSNLSVLDRSGEQLVELLRFGLRSTGLRFVNAP